MGVAFDLAAAKDAKRLIQLSHDQWSVGLTRLAGADMTDPHWRDAALRQYAHAVAVLTWARGLDDMCRGNTGQLPTYLSARPNSSRCSAPPGTHAIAPFTN
jgi:hypothetical protein